MEKIHENMHVFMLSCIKHACLHVFSPFSAYFFAHDIIAEKGPLQLDFNLAVVGLALVKLVMSMTSYKMCPRIMGYIKLIVTAG